MDAFTTHDFTHASGEVTHYYEGGTPTGTPLIFIHGWPDIAEAWHHQLTHFASTGKYRIIAPDMRGYGGSTSPSSTSAYSLEVLTSELAELASALDIQQAVWIGHDWGSGVVSSLAAHHRGLVRGLVVLSVPYRTLELGVDFLETLVNRDIYPEAEYPHGQWDYMRYYQHSSAASVAAWEANIDRITKVLYTPNDPAQWGKPAAATSTLQRDGGWFGGHAELVPDVPLAATFLTEEHYEHLLASHKKHGLMPATSYYLNHERNAEFARKDARGGELDVPVLFIDAKHDAVCSVTTSPKMGEPQREVVKDLTVEVIDSGHWVQLEKPKEVNEVLERWLGEKIKG